MISFTLCFDLTSLFLTNIAFRFAGVRTVNVDGNASDAPRGFGDRPRVHVRDAEAAADDHERGGQGADPDVPEFARPSAGGRRR